MTRPREHDVQAAITNKLRAAGFWLEKLHGDGYQRIGLSDYCGVFRGRALFLEIKRDERAVRDTHEFRATQKQVLREVRTHGGIGEVLWLPEQADLLITALRKLREPEPIDLTALRRDWLRFDQSE